MDQEKEDGYDNALALSQVDPYILEDGSPDKPAAPQCGDGDDQEGLLNVRSEGREQLRMRGD